MHRTTQFPEIIGQIDLAIPAVEAAVVVTTALDAAPVTAATWLKAFQEHTMRILAMREVTRSADQIAETTTFTRSIRP